jgi:hypothetical protein
MKNSNQFLKKKLNLKKKEMGRGKMKINYTNKKNNQT